MSSIEKMTDDELKFIVGGTGSGHDLQGCTCPNGKTFSASSGWTCAEAAKYAC
ncbi:hypothetical protein [Dysgonomonas sp. ZJ709]|uniref:hypothetical protein n=1 Tax=Dysgonomonas sp. ZJ709 TaxID=2709797 RepID=UPI0013EAE7CE|nr:hypothetical protein [Dysgonomonas sp. ZJ709]